MKGKWIMAAIGVLAAGAAVVVTASVRAKETVESRVGAILAKKPTLAEVARSSGGWLDILVFKDERRVEVHAPGWKEPRVYPMTGFSGTLGPKLREGDGQIPEGVYGIAYLNPNSRFYLSLKVSYPNEADRARGKRDGRGNLGGDIMIHGKSATIGCVPIGDDAIEDVFYLAHAVGIRNVRVVIAPYDMRKGRRPELEKSDLPWYPDLLREIDRALAGPLALYRRFVASRDRDALVDLLAACDGTEDAGLLSVLRHELTAAPASDLYIESGVTIDSRSLAAQLVGLMKGREIIDSSDNAQRPCVILCLLKPDEEEVHRNYESPCRYRLFRATEAEVARAAALLGPAS